MMAGATLSVHADEATRERVREIARHEDRPTSQVVNAALRFYTLLPEEARAALRRLEGDAAQERAARTAARAILELEAEAAEQAVAAELDPGQDVPEDEAELLAVAARLAARR
jgi:predicted transcriptional regulator